MEDRGRMYFLVVLLLCAAFGGFAYSLGWRHGESSAREDAAYRRAGAGGSAPSLTGWRATPGSASGGHDDRGDDGLNSDSTDNQSAVRPASGNAPVRALP